MYGNAGQREDSGAHGQGQVPPISVLIFDDSDFDLRRIARLVGTIDSRIEISRCKTLEEFAKLLDVKVYDICLIDHTLADGKTSADALELIKAHETGAFTPSILVSGTDDQNVIDQALENGFASFVSKNNLSVDLLKGAIADAVDEASEGDLPHETRQELVDRVMDGVTRTYSSNTKPHLEKIYNYVNFIRRCLGAGKLPSIETVDQIEARCFEIWRFLDEAENHAMTKPPRRH